MCSCRYIDVTCFLQEWWENQAKIVKLLLRCIVHVLEAEQDDADVVISIGSCLETLLGRAW